MKPHVKVVKGKYLWLTIGKGGYRMPLEEYYFRKSRVFKNSPLGRRYSFNVNMNEEGNIHGLVPNITTTPDNNESWQLNRSLITLAFGVGIIIGHFGMKWIGA